MPRTTQTRFYLLPAGRCRCHHEWHTVYGCTDAPCPCDIDRLDYAVPVPAADDDD